MQNNIDSSLRALCQAQEHKIKVQQRTLQQLQLGVASVGTLAAGYKACIDNMIEIAEQLLKDMPESVFNNAIKEAKELSAQTGPQVANAILNLAQENQRLRGCIAGYQTEQERMEAKIAELETYGT